MDYSNNYRDLARLVVQKVDGWLEATGRSIQWQDGDYFYCPHEKIIGIFMAHHAEAEAMDGHAWLPRLDQLVEIATLMGVTGYGSDVETATARLSTPEAELAKRILAAG